MSDQLRPASALSATAPPTANNRAPRAGIARPPTGECPARQCRPSSSLTQLWPYSAQNTDRAPSGAQPLPRATVASSRLSMPSDGRSTGGGRNARHEPPASRERATGSRSGRSSITAPESMQRARTAP